MQSIIALSKIETNPLSDGVALCADMAAIKILGIILESLLLPFINISLSLQQQIELISCYCHLTFALFRMHRTAFMPHVLFYDTQSMSKNICFCVAKQQKLDGRQKFWIIQMGDNDLEELFGIMRMKGGHNSAMNYSQALDRIGAAKDIDAVFKKHPELNPGSCHLKLTSVEGLDHICPDLWCGDIIASHCNLPSAWIAGHNKAIAALMY
ncbi:uncharacterized protein BJ212DRAFT_1445214 [Suillus subaureus]|uniref:Uncharacterized protein n=1 Tax=Suillus subaureus TaxID=48587 RepID=A0A9P7EI47_9AGAM|nr:uncharacterized protein BJ212DRAFT_1445214 [Suillus subaureus]KAG1821707.1 hypothetical protein BJ212DRAFT_1445214 [Suillus subaureus]